MRLRSSLVLLLVACNGSPVATPADMAPLVDLATPDAAVADFATPLDESPPTDFPPPADLAGPCQGGYLNSDMLGAACPLACSPNVVAVPDEGRNHVPYGTPVTYMHNPPASGPHWPYPAPWGVSSTVVPREWWVHNLEHGGIVLAYNCPWPADAGTDADGGTRPPNDCPDVIAAFEMLYSSFVWSDQAAFCGDMGQVTHIVVTPDPLLPTKVAAVAWDWAYTDDHVDLAALKCFIAARYNRGPEFIPCF